MFMGHFGASFLGSGNDKSGFPVPLWLAFIAVQFIDLVLVLCMLLGYEYPIHEPNHISVWHIPYSHSLMSALILAIVFPLICAVFRPINKKQSLLLAVLVLSHWLLDVIVHRGDMSFYPGSDTFGFFLWDNKLLSYCLEIGLLATGLFWWLSRTTPIKPLFRYLPIALLIIAAIMQAQFMFQPAPENIYVLVVMMLASFGLMIALIFWAESGRVIKNS